MAKRGKSKADPDESLLDKLLGDLGDDVDMNDFADLSPGEIATGTVSMIPLPLLGMLDADEQLPALWVAIDPELTTAEVDKGLGRLEDLLISTLASVRSHRRGLTDGVDDAGLKARASVKFGDAACEIIETFFATDETPQLVGVDDAMLKANLKTLKARR